MVDEHCFISYSNADALDFAHRLADELQGGDDTFIKTWFDKRDIDPARDWDDQIVEGIRSCKCMLFVMTKDSTAPGSICKNEWSWALKYKKPVVPLRLHKDAEQPFGLGNRQWIDFTGGFEQGLSKLRLFLRHMDSPEGQLDALKDRLMDAQRDLRRVTSEDQSRIQAEIDQLIKQIGEQEKIVNNPKVAEKRTQDDIAAGLERASQPEKLLANPLFIKYINPPPGIAPTYFQDRLMETEQVILFLNNDVQRLMTVLGRGGVGKTTMICRLLKFIENNTLPNELERKHGKVPINGIVYLSETGTHKVNFANLFTDLCKLLPTPVAATLDALYKDPTITTAIKTYQLLEALPVNGRVIVLLDNFETVVDSETLNIKDVEIDEALRTILHAPQHPIKVILTTRVAPRELNLYEAAHQRQLILDGGLAPEYAKESLRLMDEDGTVGLKKADDSYLDKAAQRTLGYPRALEALYAILSADRYTTLEEILEISLPENVVYALVGEAFSRLDSTSQRVMQALAIYSRPVTPDAIDYLLQYHVPGINSILVLQRLVNMHFVRRENRMFYLHPVDREYAIRRIPSTSKIDKAINNTFTCHDLTLRAARYFTQARKPRNEWKTLQDFAAQLAEFDLLCAAEEYDQACGVLNEIDYNYLYLWGHYRLLIDLRQRIKDRLNEKELIIKNLNSLGLSYMGIGYPKDALLYYEKGLQLAQDSAYLNMQSELLRNLGLAYTYFHDYHKAIELYERALVIDREIGNQSGECLALANLGNRYRELGNAEKAIEFNKQALIIAENTGDRRNEASALNGIGKAYSLLHNPFKSIEYHLSALTIRKEIGDRRGEYFSLVDLGNIFATLDESHKAILCFEEALRISREVANQRNEGDTLIAIAQTLLDIGDYQMSEECFLQASQISSELLFPDIQISAKIGLAEIQLLNCDLSAANNIVEPLLQYNTANNVNDAIVMHGIINLRKRELIVAERSFSRAVTQIDNILSTSTDDYEALNFLGLAFSGLSICKDENFIDSAIEAFHKASLIAPHAGIIKRNLRLLNELAKCDTQGNLTYVRAVVEGQGPPSRPSP